MKTPINELITWVEDMEDSVFALQASSTELQMLSQFKKKLKDTLEKEKEFGVQCFNGGRTTNYTGFSTYFLCNYNNK
jgi:hypothetical protein